MDFLESRFEGENAQKSRFLRRGEIKIRPIHHPGFNHGVALQKSSPDMRSEGAPIHGRIGPSFPAAALR
jgi:hypothetical protein